MKSHVIDSELYGRAFAPEDIASVFTDANRVRKWFQVEVALAEAQAELGMIPALAAAEIGRKAEVERIDLHRIGEQIGRTAHPLVPALRALEAVCEGDAGEYIAATSGSRHIWTMPPSNGCSIPRLTSVWPAGSWTG